MSGHISDQIVVYKNDKVLVELRDKLKVASVANYAHIHATGEQTGNGTKRTSLIGILMKDYSKGTKDQAVTVTANVSPEEIRFLFSRLNAGFPAVDFKQEKIIRGSGQYWPFTGDKAADYPGGKRQPGKPA